MQTDHKIFILGIVGVEAILFSVVIWMAVTASVLFRPQLGAGEAYAITSFVKPIFWMVALGAAHHWVQRWFTANRPGAVPFWMIVFDYITSFLPFAVLLISLLYMGLNSPVKGYASWWLWTMTLYAVIVLWATSDDVYPTICVIRKGRT